MEFQNHYLREALCAFRYEVDAANAEPALEYFHRFYTALKQDGFTSHEQQPFELTIRVGNGSEAEAITPELSKGHPSLVLCNEATGYAIIIGIGVVSFNCLKPYPGWEVFLAELVHRYLPVYKALNIKQELRAAQMAYINDFDLDADEVAHDYLLHLPQLAELAGAVGAGHASQSHFHLPPATTVTLQTNVLIGQPGTLDRVVLECNAITTAADAADELMLATTAHAAARAAFMSVASAKFKESIA